MINENCPSCGSKKNRVVYDVTHPLIHADVGLAGIIKRCTQCNLLFKSFNRNTSEIYDEKYAVKFKEMEEYSGSSAYVLLKKIIQKSSNRIKANGRQPKLLDIGSGIGIMLETAKQAGFDPTGVELSTVLAEEAKAKGFKIINKDVSEMSSTEKFDIISMMDIIEHLENPNSILEALKNLLQPEGELIVYTPNHDSLIVKIADVFYKIGITSPIENIFACTHTCFFTTKTLKETLSKAGYAIIQVDHFNYDTSRPGQKVSTLAKIGINIIEFIGGLLGYNGFRVVIYANKIKD